MTAKRIAIIQLTGSAIDALAAADLPAARRRSGLDLTDYFIDADNLGTWQIRSAQLVDDPAAATWITGVVWDLDEERAVGRAGFHGPPDDVGMVEVGYSIDPDQRRRGYARATLASLLDRAGREPDVRTVRASIAPDNVPSLNLVREFGFVEVGEQWDDEDGLEIIYEVPAPDPG